MFNAKNIEVHDLIEVVITILNARNPYTFGHSWRVAALSHYLAQMMEMPPEREEIIHIAAHLHDIGKVGIPDSILNKETSLTNEEYKCMKEHSALGASIINKLPILDEIALYVRHHHERWDGKGYPDGLKGKQIPFGARIIAVADVFDSITTSRPYSQAGSFNQAFEEIRRVDGTQLCPEVCAALLQHHREVVDIIEKTNREIGSRDKSFLYT